MKFIINATAQTPLSFRSGRSDTDTSTLTHIPGSAMLGGLAQAHTLLHPGQTTQFEQFFLRGVRFSNLYPSYSKKWDENEKAKQSLTDVELAVYPLPNTARSCKRFPGFRFDANKNGEQHGVSDHLFSTLLFELSGQTHINALERQKKCSHSGCSELMDHIDGFYRRGFNGNEYGQPKAKEILRTRTGINRFTGTVQQQILYSRTALTEGSTFWGTIDVSDEVADKFLDFVESAGETGLIRVGNNRTRGFGRINIGLNETPIDKSIEKTKLIERLDRFNTALQTEAKSAGITLKHSFYVPLMLTADAILYDHLLRPQTTLTEDYFQRIYQLDGVEIVYRNFHARRVMGWNNLWRLPKADDLALTMGSVFVLGFNQPSSDNIYQTLLELQLNGIGERRNEGFGQLLIANPFHWEAKNV